MGAFVLLAGGRPGVAAGLAAAMAALQASIGAINDLIDASADAVVKPAKPIPSGLVGRRTARVVAILAGLGGLLVAGTFGLVALVVATAGYALGLAYDLRLKRSRWSWLPYALALPLVPAFAWLGAGLGFPPRFPLLVAMALLAGLALAVGNGLIDLEGDAVTGSAGPAGALGRATAWRLMAACHAVVAAIALATAGGPPRAGAAWLVLLAGATILAAGVVLSRADGAGRRQLGWEGQAAGIGLLAVGWFATQVGVA